MAVGRGQSLDGLFEAYGRIAELDFDDAFAEHMAAEQRGYGKHRVSEQEIREVLPGTPGFFENIGERRAPVVMLGPTRAGRLVVAPLEPTHRAGVWRPVTAFEANAHHRQRYAERR